MPIREYRPEDLHACRALYAQLVEHHREIYNDPNASAIQAFHDLGFRTLGHVQLFMSLDRAGSYWRTGPELHGRAFDC